MCGIYKITNLVNGKSYIGQSIDIHRRWYEHKRDSKLSSVQATYPLYRAFQKYGIENFSFEILEETTKEELNKKERYYIQLYDSYNNGYNQTLGGQAMSTSKLTDNDVKEIYSLLIENIVPQIEIAQKYNVGKDIISSINHGRYYYNKELKYPLRPNPFEATYCPQCGKKICYDSNLCLECYHLKLRKVERPSKEELFDIICNYNGNFTQVGKIFGVSDNAVRKWCKGYGIPSLSREYKQIIRNK